MKNIKLLSCTLALGLIVGLAGCGSKTATPSASADTTVASDTASEAPSADAVSESPSADAVSKAPTTDAASEAPAEGTAKASSDTVVFKDPATSLSFTYPSNWKTEPAQVASTIPGADSTLIVGIESPDALGILGIYKINMDLGTGDEFKTAADKEAKAMFSKEKMDVMLPSLLRRLEPQRMTASLADTQISVPITISGNTFYRTSIQIGSTSGSDKIKGSYEYIVGGANDNFFVFMGSSVNETNFDAINSIISTISFD